MSHVGTKVPGLENHVARVFVLRRSTHGDVLVRSTTYLESVYEGLQLSLSRSERIPVWPLCRRT